MCVRPGQSMLSARLGANCGKGRNAGIRRVRVMGPCTGLEIHENYDNAARTRGTSVSRESKETHVVVFVSKVIGLDWTDSMISEQCCSSPCDFKVANGCFGLAQDLVDFFEGETSQGPEIHATVASPGMKSRDFGSVWPRILYLWDFEEADGCFGLAQALMDSFMILAQFGHGYYIRGTLKWLMDVLVWLRASWIRVNVKQVTDQKSMPPLHCWRGNAHKSHDLAQFDHGYYICETLKRLTDVVAWPKACYICTRNPFHCCLAGEEMPTKVVILAQFDRGYYIRGTFKRLTDVVVRLKAWWIRFDHGYYIRGTLKRLTDVVARLKAW
ncbi:hypothetical protein C8R44DRAFT_735887 [Mycena epipterygia]|nr:hypothetical protein C8R44DRAFT_735887 [Mycena epipterygia]